MSHTFWQYFSLYWGFGFTGLPSAVRKAFDSLIWANSPRMPLRFSTDVLLTLTQKVLPQGLMAHKYCDLSSPFQRKHRKILRCCFNWCPSKSFIQVHMKVCSLVPRSMHSSANSLFSPKKNSSKTKQHGLAQKWCFQYLSRALMSFKSRHLHHFLQFQPMCDDYSITSVLCF